MNIIVLEESKGQKEKFLELLEEKGNEVTGCLASGDFMESVESVMPDLIIMNVQAWQHGLAIYTHFNFVEKLEEIPIIFYNAPDNFPGITDRAQCQEDKIYHNEIEVEVIVNEL